MRRCCARRKRRCPLELSRRSSSVSRQPNAGNARSSVASARLSSPRSRQWRPLTGISTRKRSTASRWSNWPQASSSSAGTNLIMIGQAGVGKSHLIQAMGRKACAFGYRVLYRTSAQLITDLTASLADKTLPQLLRFYSRPQLLIIDEWGFDRVERLESPQAAHLLYKVVAARNQQCSTALVSNIDFDRWGDYMADGPLAMAFLDRLIEGAIIIKIKGDSYRARRKRNGEKASSCRSATASSLSGFS